MAILKRENVTTLQEFHAGQTLQVGNRTFSFSSVSQNEVERMEEENSGQWLIVAFRSDYYGSHDEDGEGSRTYLYGVKNSYRVFLNTLIGEDFSHGHFSASKAEKAFDDKSEDESDFILLA